MMDNVPGRWKGRDQRKEYETPETTIRKADSLNMHIAQRTDTPQSGLMSGLDWFQWKSTHISLASRLACLSYALMSTFPLSGRRWGSSFCRASYVWSCLMGRRWLKRSLCFLSL